MTTASPPAAATERVMLLIDADNVSVDVMEQAVDKLLADHGALHVRRAYCTAECAVANQAVFKRLSIKPMVNLSAGKNSTDIAMAVDALDLVLAERPDVVAIASSDSDFAPLVARLREKGCRVLGFGQQGKTGDETQMAYDAFTVFAHRKAREPAARAPARAARPARPVRAAAEAPPAARSPAPAAKRGGRRKAAGTAAADAPDAEPAAPSVAPPAARQPPAAPPPPEDEAGMHEPVTAPATAPAPTRTPVAAADPTPPPRPPVPRPPPRRDMPDKLRQILAALPELVRGGTVELRVAAERLRDADLLGPKASSTKLFAPFADYFEMLPEKGPNRVRLRG